jgi:FkbM family methyltransferase
MQSHPLVIDIGMYDGADTRYYLETDHRVIAVEANPVLVKRALYVFHHYIYDGDLEVLHRAIAPDAAPVTLFVNSSHLGGSSIVPSAVHGFEQGGTYQVQGCTMKSVIERAGERAKLIKVDIEGVDDLCVDALTPENRPEYFCIEAHGGPAAKLRKLAAVGFTRFKLIDQVSLRAVENIDRIADRLLRKVMRSAGLEGVQFVRRAGRYFAVKHSSGPAPWESDGEWHSADDILGLWAAEQTRKRKGDEACPRWFDLHAN